MTDLFFRLTLGVLLALGISANAQEANQAKPEGGPREGIKVHGHWTIEVRNPDGKLVTHREFENSLTTGAIFLAPVLSRTATMGAWFVQVRGSSADPCLLGNVPFLCTITEPSSSFNGFPVVFPNLTVSAPLPGSPGAGTLTLAGNFTAQNASQIATVITGVLMCAPTVAPANCPPISSLFTNNSGTSFSGTAITPISVTVGQFVQVTVVFSFS